MYGYIYDVFLHQKVYEKELIRIEHSLTDLGLQGSKIRLSLINNIGHAVEDLLRRGVKTIVVIGSDQLFSKLVDQTVDQDGITLGLIPMGSHNQLAEIFGIPDGAEACQVLSARLIRPVQISQINSAYFIHSVTVDAAVTIEFDQRFSVAPVSDNAQISIYNLTESDPETGDDEQIFSVTITPQGEKGWFGKTQSLASSIIKSPRIKILEPRGIPIIVDGQKIVNTPAELTISDKSVQVVMGRDRQLG